MSAVAARDPGWAAGWAAARAALPAVLLGRPAVKPAEPADPAHEITRIGHRRPATIGVMIEV